VAKRNPGRAGRSRKRRPTAQSTPPATPTGEQPAAKSTRRAREREPTTAASYKAPMSVGERPQAPWHPLPLSELLILVGAIGTVIALRRGEVKTGGAALFASLGAVGIGTIEVTLREHLSGYRSHTTILALLPTIVFHSVVVLTLAAFVQLPRLATTGMLILDGALFAFLFKVLRARFLDARRERVSAGRG
jgi:hypothetical protein